MRGWVATGFALCAVATLTWLPEFTHPLLSGVLLGASSVGLVLAAAHWRAAGLAMAIPAWFWFGTRFTAMDAVVAFAIGVGLALALAGEHRRSIALLVTGLLVAGIVQAYWIFSNMAPDNPFLLGNVLFTAGALLAALGAWRAHPWTRPATTPETVK